MIHFNYKLTSYSKFLYDLALVFDTEMQGNVLILPAHIGEGFLGFIEFNGVDTLIYNFSLNEELVIKREKDKSEFYTLVFDEVHDSSKFSFEIGQNLLEEERVRNTAIYLTSFLFDTQYTFFKDIKLRGIRVRLSTEWLKKYLLLPDMEDVLESYVAMKTENFWSKPIDAESRELLHTLLQKPEDAHLLFYQNKVLRIVELFFLTGCDNSPTAFTTNLLAGTTLKALKK